MHNLKSESVGTANKSIESSSQSIIKSIAILGSVSFITLITGIIRNKVIAMTLGAAGIGLSSLFLAVVELIRSFSGLGLNYSAVKFISSKKGNETERINLSTTLFLIAGIIGAVICVVFRSEISQYNFGDNSKSFEISLLAIPVFLTTVSQGIFSILQGIGRIKLLSKINLSSNVIALLISLPFYFLFGLKAIIIGIITSSVVIFTISCWLVYKIILQSYTIEVNRFLSKTSSLFAFGGIMMISGIINNGTFLYLKNFLIRNGSLETLGYFQSSFSLTNMAINTILIGVSADFFAKANKLKNNKEKFNLYTLKQTSITTLLAIPIITSLIIFSKEILFLLYSSEFVDNYKMLNLFLFGAIIRVYSWTYRFAIMSLDNGKSFIITEIIWHGGFLVLFILLYEKYGLVGTGIGYLTINVMYMFVLISFLRQKTNYKIGYKSHRNLILGFLIILIALISTFFFQSIVGYLVGGILIGLTILLVYKDLLSELGTKSFLKK